MQSISSALLINLEQVQLPQLYCKGFPQPPFSNCIVDRLQATQLTFVQTLSLFWLPKDFGNLNILSHVYVVVVSQASLFNFNALIYNFILKYAPHYYWPFYNYIIAGNLAMTSLTVSILFYIFLSCRFHYTVPPSVRLMLYLEVVYL